MNTKYLRKILLIILFAYGLALGSCDLINSDKESNPAVAAKTIVMDTTLIVSTLNRIDSNTGTMYFNGLSDIDVYKVGCIICSEPSSVAPYGFFYKIKKITRNGEQTIIETEDASLEEAIENAEISTMINLDDYVIGFYDKNDNIVEFAVAPDNLTKSNQSAASFKIININRNVSASTGTGSISIAASLTLSVSLDFDVIIKNNNLEYFRLACKMESNLHKSFSGEVQGTLSLVAQKGEREGESNEGIRLGTIKLKPIRIMVGYVPVVITHEIPVFLKIDLSGKMQVDMEIKNTSSMVVGVLFKDEKLEKILYSQSNSTSSSKTVLSGGIKVTIEPQYALSLYGLKKNNSVETFVGLYGEATLSHDIVNLVKNGKYGLNPELAINYGIDAGIRTKLKIFSKKFVDMEVSTEILEKKELLKSSVFPQWNDIRIDIRTPFVDVSTTAKASPFIFPVPEYGIVVSKSSLPNIYDDSRFSSGALPITLSNDNPPVASSHLVNLEPNTTYYVCPYYLNWFGDFYGNVTSFKTEAQTSIGDFQLDFVVNEYRESTSSGVWLSAYKHCNTSLILHDNRKATLSNFFINEMNWGIVSSGWPSYTPTAIVISWSNGSSAGLSGYHYTYWDNFKFVWLNLRFSGDINKVAIGEVLTGTIEMGDLNIYNTQIPTHRGPASMTRIR